jgi:hypothetical protein
MGCVNTRMLQKKFNQVDDQGAPRRSNMAGYTTTSAAPAAARSAGIRPGSVRNQSRLAISH